MSREQLTEESLLEISEGTEGHPTAHRVIELQMHDLPAWKKNMLERISLMVSEAVSSLMAFFQKHLNIAYETKNEKQKIAKVELIFEVNKQRGENILKLLQKIKLDKDGNAREYSNSYRFVSCEQIADDSFRVVCELGKGKWTEKTKKDGTKTFSHQLSLLQAKFLQGLIMTYVDFEYCTVIPHYIRRGICQEASQQICSHIELLNSDKRPVHVEFPNVLSRDPQKYQAVYNKALDDLKNDASPLERCKLREIDPSIPEDDKRGDKQIICDERWVRMVRSFAPRQIPILFTDGKIIRLVQAQYAFDAGISKEKRHRGELQETEKVFKDRPKQVQLKQHTGLNQIYALIPVLNIADASLQEILKKRDANKNNSQSKGRGLNLNFSSLPIYEEKATGKFRLNENEMMVPLSFDRKRTGKMLFDKTNHIAWSRIVNKQDQWYLQLTMEVSLPNIDENKELLLGIGFEIDKLHWFLYEQKTMRVVEKGYIESRHSAEFLKHKESLENRQKNWRSVHQKKFQRFLRQLTIEDALMIIRLAQQKKARLVLEEIFYVQKSSPDSDLNMLYNSWNYGQMLKKIFDKASEYGISEPFKVSDFVTRFTCPNCGAIRKAKQTESNANTWRCENVLECRKCGFKSELTVEQRVNSAIKHTVANMKKHESECGETG